MPIEIIVPRLGWSMEEGGFVAWLKKEGDFVRAGEPLFSIEGDKAVQEIEEIDSGVLRIAANAPKPGAPIRVGSLLGHLLSPTEAAVASAPPALAAAVAPAQKAGAAAPIVPIAKASPPSIQPGGRPAISPRALRIAAELGVDWTTAKGTGRSGRIRERDIRAAAESHRKPGLSARISEPRHPVLAKPAILVTGGCGFIGTWVVRELLDRGLDVVVIDAGARPERWDRVIGTGCGQVPLLQGSLLDRDLIARVFQEHSISHVIHLAALLTPACQADPWEGCRVNVLGAVALFEQIRKSVPPIRGFSYASSVAVFGAEPDHASGAVPDLNHPVTFYGAFKKSVELIAEQYWSQFQIASVGIRPQVAYGPERDAGLTAGPSLAARAAARGEPFSINYTGRIGYDYVEDVARAFVRGALETPPGALTIDLPGELADVTQVIAAIRAVAPESSAKLSAGGPLLPTHTPSNPRFISSLYPDWNTTPLTEGIRRTVEFYRVPTSGPAPGSGHTLLPPTPERP